MNFKIIHRSAIDAQKWNRCLEKYQMDIYNEFYFLNAVCIDNWYGFVWGDYDKILPFYQKKKWGIIPYVCMPPFCQKFDNSPLTRYEWDEAFKYLKQNNWTVDYAILDKKDDESCQKRFNFILNKTDSPQETIQESYASLLKKNLSKAKRDLDICKEPSNSVLEGFLNDLPIFKELVLKKFSSNFWRLKTSKLRYYYACDKASDKPLAILMYAIFSSRVYLLFPYSTEEGKKKQAMSLLINHIIEDSAVKIIDFEGSSIESIANFYAQFGAEKQTYWTIHWKSRFFPI